MNNLWSVSAPQALRWPPAPHQKKKKKIGSYKLPIWYNDDTIKASANLPTHTKHLPGLQRGKTSKFVPVFDF